ncbi:TPA: LamG domain-containing protein [bacterium]|nr:LamG domain-containing protein [bacterium]
MFKKNLISTTIIITLIFMGTQAFSADGFDYIPDANTLALWHFDSDNGDKIKDASPNKFDGAVEGKSQFGDEGWKKDGEKGKAFVFDGTTVINVGKVKKLIKPEAMTIEAWVFPDDLSGWKLICCNWGGAVVGAWHFGVEAGTPKLHLTNKAGTTAFAGDGKIEVGKWQHVAGTYDGKSIKVYINGIPAGESKFDGELKDNDMDVVIGSKDSREYQWKGRMDEVRISDKAREPKELSPNMTAPMTVRPTAKVATTWANVKAF